MENNFNLETKEVNDIELIKGYLDSNIPVYLHGLTGCGKSDRVEQIDPDLEKIYLRNATPELINGKAVYVPPITKKVEVNVNGSIELQDVIVKEGYMMDIKPAWLERITEKCIKEPDRIHVLFFDELSNAMPTIQGYVFNIVLNHEVNGRWKLPDNVRICAAGNDMEESLAANEIAQPLFSRFAHVYIDTNFKNWYPWACEHRIHPLVIAYHYKNKGEYLRTEYTGTNPNCDPRKWEMVSKVLYETGELSIIDNLIDKRIAEDFIKFCSTPIVPLEAIIDNELYPEAEMAASEFREGNESLLYAASLSQVDEEHIAYIYPIVLNMKPKYRDLFIKMWVSNDKRRLNMIKDFNDRYLGRVKVSKTLG